VEAALVLLERMGLSPADLTAVPQSRKLVPTFAEYVPVVSAVVSAGTRRAYGSYWNRVIEHWGDRRLDEPTPSEIRQLMAYVKTHVVARRNARGGRSAEEHLVAALRCLYRRAVDDGLITEAGNPARKVAKPRRLPATRRALPDARLAEINQIAATTGDDPELDTLLLRLHTETACRRGGALALRPRDLDPDQCLVLLWEKGETVRWQPVSPTLMARLVEHGRERHAPPDGQLLRYGDGKPITSRRYDHLWRRIGRHLPWVATQGISTHWIRHTILTWVEGRGVASDATFRLRRGAGAVRAAALRASGLAGWRCAGHAAGAGVLAAGCAGWQDVASRSVALGDQLMRSAHARREAGWGQGGGRSRWLPRTARRRCRRVRRCWRRCWRGGGASSRPAG
jgi:integrase